MADKKKKSTAKNLLNSSRKKLVTEIAKESLPDLQNSSNSVTQALLKGKSSKAIKQSTADLLKQEKKRAIEQMGEKSYREAVKRGELRKIESKQSLTQAVLSGSSKKAIKGLILEPFRVKELKQRELNKEYRKERGKLIRRIGYFKKKGFDFNSEEIAPRLSGNATPEDIQRLRELRERKLRDLAISFTPPTVATDSASQSDIITPLVESQIEAGNDDFDLASIDDSIPIDYSDEMFENDPENYMEEDDFHPTFDDLVFNESESFFPELESKESPVERYYRENDDRTYAGDDATVQAGLVVLNNAWEMLNQQDSYLSVMPMREANRQIKEEAAVQLSEMLSKAEDSLGQEKLAIILQKHASEFNSAVEKALRWRDSNDIDETRAQTSYSLTQINNILFSYDPALLSEYSTGNPADL